MESDSSLVAVEEEKGHQHKIEKNQLENNFIQTVLQPNFFPPLCSSCKNVMQFAEGDVIYGDKWYHKSCWEEIEKLADFISE